MSSLCTVVMFIQLILALVFSLPRKSRSVLRVAIGHYKELQDRASSDEEAESVQMQFGLAIYVSLIASRSSRSPLVDH